MAEARRELDLMLREHAEASGAKERRRVEEAIWSRYGKRCAVFVSDLSGFSRLTARTGIVHFLGLIQRSRDLLHPIMSEGRGQLIKTTADNIYAIFPDAASAVDASIAMQRRLAEHNRDLDPEQRIGLCIGIGYGDVLVVGEEDFFGHQLNLAFKLGEDTAEPEEILLTADALAAAGPADYPHDERIIHASGLAIPHAAIRY
jgi:class 3 adenylate cyclase